MDPNATLSLSKGCNEQFYEFFISAQHVLQKELDNNKANAYQVFIIEKFQEMNLFDDGEPEGENNENSEYKKKSLVTCEEIVADFAFLSMSKVM